MVVIILLSGSLIVFNFGSLGKEDNWFNKNYRLKLAQYPILRYVIGLHYDGDGRSDYLGSRFDKIVVEIDSLEGITPNTQALEDLVSRIKDVTGKETNYLISNSDIPAFEFDSEEVGSFIDRLRVHSSSSGAASVYVLYAGVNKDEPTLLGQTFKEYGIIVYSQALDNFVSQNPATKKLYESSTILHEFGHQLGLGHNDKANCLMNESAEYNHKARFRAEGVIMDFCPLELQQIRFIKNSL